MSRKLRWAMVGGGQGALIGEVHRRAARLTGQFELVAGALSSTPERARASGREVGLADDRNYSSWEDMLTRELTLPPGERAEGVSIVTPNHLHYPVARAFAGAGFHVVCDKPLVHTSAQARELGRVVHESGVLFAVTYNYSGYPMVRQARDLVRGGVLGDVRKVLALYHQGWLSGAQAGKQAEWRTDPARSGLAGAVGDIGSHAENLIMTVTGLELEALCADLTTFVPGRALDDDASVLLRFRGGARGLLTATQVAAGHANDLSLHVFGTRGSLIWRQETPGRLDVLPRDSPAQVWTRGSPYLSPAAQAAAQLPGGHPEGFLEAFSNIYRGVAETLLAHEEGRPAEPPLALFPGLEEGARGVQFIERVVESAHSEAKWTGAAWSWGQSG